MQSNTFLKPLQYLLNVLQGIPFEIRSWKVPRTRKGKKRVPGMLE